MNCDNVNKSINAYVDGEMPETVRQKIEEHLFNCEKCRNLVYLYEQINKTSRNVKTPNPGKEYWNALPKRILSQVHFGPRNHPVVPFKINFRLAAVVATCVVVFIITWSMNRKYDLFLSPKHPAEKSGEVSHSSESKKQNRRDRGQMDALLDEAGSGTGSAKEGAAAGPADTPELKIEESASRSMPGRFKSTARQNEIVGVAGEEKRPELSRVKQVPETAEPKTAGKKDSAHYHYHLNLTEIMKNRRPDSPALPETDAPITGHETMALADKPDKRERQTLFSDISANGSSLDVAPASDAGMVESPVEAQGLTVPAKDRQAGEEAVVKSAYNLSDTLFVLQHLIYQPAVPASDSGDVTFTALLKSYHRSDLRAAALGIPRGVRPSAVLQVARLFVSGVQNKNLDMLQPAALDFYTREKTVLLDSLGTEKYTQMMEILKSR